MQPMTPTPFARPLYVMCKPAGSSCNLACEYCYYLEKSKMFAAPAGERPTMVMSDAMLEDFTRLYLQSQTMPRALFTWHGGEALMRPLSFYRRALELQRKYGGGMVIDNCIQTNGTMLTDEWCRFFKDNGWLVGVSIDGPREFHDEYRRNRMGQPSFRKVMHGIELLKKHGVDWNGMAVVNDYNADYPLEFYHFFKEIECRFIQFTPIVERLTAHSDGRRLAAVGDSGAGVALAPFSVSPGQWGRFLCAVFDEWVRGDVGSYFIQLFDAVLANYMGEQPGVCSMARTCGHAGVMEYNGDVFSCDHFVFPEYRLGNIRTHTLVEMMHGERQTRFGLDKRDRLPGYCRRCRWLDICNGECPKNRFAVTPDGEPGLNYLCEGYRRFYEHSAPAMEYMRDALRSGRPAADVMEWLRTRR